MYRPLKLRIRLARRFANQLFTFNDGTERAPLEVSASTILDSLKPTTVVEQNERIIVTEVGFVTMALIPEAASYQIQIKQQSEERKEARKSSKDYTRYIFNNNTYNKRKLALAIVQSWIATNTPNSLEELSSAFPQSIHRSGLFASLDKAREIYSRQGRRRHFLKENETIRFPNGEQYALSNQWGKDNIVGLISRAQELGYQITEKQ